MLDQHKQHITKCIDVVKKLLKEKSNIEKKEARQRCMQNRLRLGQFVTQRVGATFQENWTDGYAFQELARRQDEITSEREEIDRQKKLLLKKRPSNSETGRKRNATPATTATLHNGTEATFLKPDAVAPPSGFSWQEYYESDEILKVILIIFFPFIHLIMIYFILLIVKTKCVEKGRCRLTIRNGKIRTGTKFTYSGIKANTQ